MKKVMMVTMVAAVLGMSTIAFAGSGCGYGLQGNGGYGCSVFRDGNGWCGSMMSSMTSYIQAAGNCCWAGIVDFFKGSTNSDAARVPSRNTGLLTNAAAR